MYELEKKYVFINWDDLLKPCNIINLTVTTVYIDQKQFTVNIEINENVNGRFIDGKNVLIYRLITGQETVALCSCDRISLILLINYDQFRSQLYSSNTLAEKCG